MSTTSRDEILDALTRARALVQKGWTQGHFARDDRGHPCSSMGDMAASFCMAGAVFAACDGNGTRRAVISELSKTIERGEYHTNNLSCFNDARDRNKLEVLAVFDRAIAARST